MVLEQGAWKEVRLKEVARVDSGGPAPQGKSYFGGPFKFIRVQHVDVDGETVHRWDAITQAAVDRFRLKLFPAGTILLPKSGASVRLEKRAVLQWPAYVVSHLATIAPGPRVDRSFLFHALRRIRFGADKRTGYPTLKLAELRATKILLPPLEVQQKIGRALSTVANSKAAQQRALDTYKGLHVSLGESLSGDRARGSTRGWRTVTLREVVQEGPQNGFYRHLSYYGKGTSIVRITDYPNGGGIVTSAENRVQLEQKELATFKLSKGDILVNRVNSVPFVGKAALVGDANEPLVFESNMMRMRIDPEKAVPEYIFRVLCLPFTRSQFQAKSKRAVAQSSINQNDVLSVRIPLCDLDEQARVVESYRAVQQASAAQEAVMAATSVLESSMREYFFQTVGKRAVMGSGSDA
jgi:Type I restriction modification DNA specificity domain